MVRKFFAIALSVSIAHNAFAICNTPSAPVAEVKRTAEVAQPACGIVKRTTCAVKNAASSTAGIINSVYHWALGNRVITAAAVSALVAYAIYFDEVNEKLKNGFDAVADKCGCGKPKPQPKRTN